jgi:hypothetical protein
MIGGPKWTCVKTLRARQQPIACAVGAMFASPALQRGVGVTNNPSGVL